MSYKLIDKAKKTRGMDITLKAVLEAYLSYGNKDGTSIRPTQRKVGERAGCRRGCVSTHTKTLVRLGILVHDLTPSGEYLKYDYPKHGVWAYVYHVDAERLSAPEVIAEFNNREDSIRKVRSDAATNRWHKRGRGVATSNTGGVATSNKHPDATSNNTPCCNEHQTRVPICNTDPSLTSYPTQEEDDPSVTSVTEEEECSRSLLSQDNQIRGSEDEQKVKSVDQTRLEWFLNDPQVMPDKSRIVDGEYQWRSGTRQDLDKFGALWLSRTGSKMDEDDYELLCDLASRHSWEDVGASIDLIFRCPITAKVAWRDFEYFYNRYDYTLARARAWELAQERTGAVGGKTNPNPEDSNAPSADSDIASDNSLDFSLILPDDPLLKQFHAIVVPKGGGKWSPPEVKFLDMLRREDEYSRLMSAVIRRVVAAGEYVTYEKFVNLLEEARELSGPRVLA